MQKIEIERVRRLRRRAALLRFSIASSVVVAIGSFAATWSNLFDSQFWNLASLAWTDSDLIVLHFNTYIFSLLETLPVLEMVVLLLPIFLVLVLFANYYAVISQKNGEKRGDLGKMLFN